MNTRNYAWLTAILLIAGLLGWTAPGMAGIATTKHNLSASGTGTYKATSETQLCVFCHTPHNANPAVPLWNHKLSAEIYTPYSSNTLAAAAPGQPSGTSKLCLTCHDGTVALGGVQNLPFAHQAGTVSGLEAFLTGPANLGSDLRNDHPISFLYDPVLAATNLELVSPALLTGKIKPDSTGQMQCTSCHDAHSDANPKFMHVGYTDGAGYGSPLCRTCHSKMYWSTVTNQSHRESLAQWNGTGDNPWHVPGHNLPLDANSTPKANGCESCHQPHNAATSGSRILKQDGEAKVCLVCHSGSVATGTKNIDYALGLAYVHPAKNPAYDGRHNPKRIGGAVREEASNLGTNRHAECEDCHNPHAVSPGVSPNVGSGTPTSNLASNVLKGIWGVSPTWPAIWGNVTSYTEVNDVQYQYQLCLKCHSYYAFGLTPPPEPYAHDPVTMPNLTDQAKEFNPNNKSFHPVVAPGKNDFIAYDGVSYTAALIGGMTPASVMGCADCHSDSQNPTGMKGPHGADYWPILWGPYDFSTGMNGTDHHLCFKCHDRGIYGGGTNTSAYSTGFSGRMGGAAKNLHNRHIDFRNMPCYACHAAVPHGWKRRAFLVYGTGTPDEAPYNAHARYPINGSTIYGLNSGINLDAIQSGNWRRTDCHSASDPGTTGVTGVGSCS
ncbi:MAG: cytochrome c3 family protein [Sulfuricella sp.]|jgi:hypothetical protein